MGEIDIGAIAISLAVRRNAGLIPSPPGDTGGWIGDHYEQSQGSSEGLNLKILG